MLKVHKEIVSAHYYYNQPNLWKVDLSKVINQEIQYAWKKKSSFSLSLSLKLVCVCVCAAATGGQETTTTVRLPLMCE